MKICSKVYALNLVIHEISVQKRIFLNGSPGFNNTSNTFSGVLDIMFEKIDPVFCKFAGVQA